MNVQMQRRSGQPRVAGAGVVGLFCLILLSACVAEQSDTATLFPQDLQWPAQSPKVRLAEVIDLGETAESGRGKMRKWLGQERAAPVFRRPYGVAWDAESLLVADPDAGTVARIDPEGRMAFASSRVFEQPIALTACWEGVIVSDSGAGRVVYLDADLQVRRWLARDLVRPTGVACLGDELFVAETGEHRILAMTREGDVRVIGGRGGSPGQYNFPTSLATHGGRLFVGDAMNFRVQVIEPRSGEALTTFGTLGDSAGEMPRLKGVAVDRGGRIWVADAMLDKISLYDTEGALLLSIGRQGDGPADFAFPAGIAAHPDGRVAVVDSLNHRLKIFEPIPSDSGT